ncbi:MAG: sulfate adenylyltransferase, partial [Myxococcales bacterium]
METLVAPHGGALTERIVPPAEEPSLRELAATLPSLVLDAREQADLELIAVGAASPLRGFLGSADYESVLARMRLADGTVWPLPLTLAVSDEDAARLERGSPVALRDGRGNLWAVLTVSEIHRRDPAAEARAVYRTEDP